MPKLRELRLYANRMTGSIPTEVGLASKLESLRLETNFFTGSLPSEIGSLTLLTDLDLKNNAFTGSIPAQYGRLAELEEWTLEGNLLTGDIPLGVCDLLKEKLGQFVVDCRDKRRQIGFDCEPTCCTLCRDLS